LNRRSFETVRALQPKVVFGLTATLEMKKKHVAMPAQAIAGPVIFSYPVTRGMSEGYLSPGVVVGVDLARDALDGVDAEDVYVRHVVQSRRRNDVIEALVREALKRGKYVLLLVERRLHIRLFHRRLQDVPHALLWGGTRGKDRMRYDRDFDAGKFRLLIANKVAKKGHNILRVDVVMDAASRPSRNDALQKFGRGVRLFDGKLGLVYLDIGDVGDGNPLQKTTRRRRRAFIQAGLPLVRLLWNGNPVAVFERAERALRRVAKRFHKAA
jgi:superfamily II DNA or RNA helicase